MHSASTDANVCPVCFSCTEQKDFTANMMLQNVGTVGTFFFCVSFSDCEREFAGFTFCFSLKPLILQ